jgi:hypothetical protein
VVVLRPKRSKNQPPPRCSRRPSRRSKRERLAEVPFVWIDRTSAQHGTGPSGDDLAGALLRGLRLDSRGRGSAPELPDLQPPPSTRGPEHPLRQVRVCRRARGEHCSPELPCGRPFIRFRHLHRRPAKKVAWTLAGPRRRTCAPPARPPELATGADEFHWVQLESDANSSPANGRASSARSCTIAEPVRRERTSGGSGGDPPVLTVPMRGFHRPAWGEATGALPYLIDTAEPAGRGRS